MRLTAEHVRKAVRVVRAARGLVQLVADAADWLDEHVLPEPPDDDEKKPERR